MKKVYLLLILIPTFIAYKSNGMAYQVRKTAKTEWEELIAKDPSMLPKMDAFLHKEVETYQPGFVRWNWEPAVDKPRGFWHSIFVTRSIAIPYYDLLLISKYLEGKIPKQAIMSRLSILHHEIAHLAKQHKNMFHPSSEKVALVSAAMGNPHVSEEKRAHLVHQASQALMQNEREADYGIPNNPDFTGPAGEFFSYLPQNQPRGPLDITSHPESAERAQTLENRTNKLRIGKMISAGNVTFAGDKLPNIQGTSPLKAAKLLGIEDTDYYQALSKKDHPLDILITSDKNNEPIMFPYASTQYSENMSSFLKKAPKNSTSFSFNIQELIKDVVLDASDLMLLEKILKLLDTAFQESLLYHEVIQRFNALYMLQSSVREKAHLAALAAIFKIKIIDQAIFEYYDEIRHKKRDLSAEREELEYIAHKNENSLLRYGAQHIIDMLESKK